MHDIIAFISCITSTLILSLLAHATPPNIVKQNTVQGFQVPVLRVPRIWPPAPLGNVLSIDIPIINRHEFAYLVLINVGGQDFSVLLDTGSSDFWIVSADCTTSDCNGVHKYSNTQSSTLSISEKPFKLSYLMGSVTGNVAYETVDIGPFAISSQVFALANSTINLGLFGTGSSGILGLCFPSIAAISLIYGETLLENIFSAFEESNRFFAFKLGRGSGLDDGSSSFIIGKLDPMITDDITRFSFTPVSQAGASSFNYWKLPLHSLVINTIAFPLSPSLLPGTQAPVAVLDTGTTLILGPTADVEALWLFIGQGGTTRKNVITGMWEVKCNRAVSVSFLLGDGNSKREYPVNPSDINWVEGGSSDGWCMGGIQANDEVNSGDWLLGDVFLRNVYVTHHHSNSTHPPLIGLLNITDPLTSMLQFREERGPDHSHPLTPRIQHTVPTTFAPHATTVCAVSSVSGFVGGVILTIVIRVRRDRWCR